MGNILSYKNDNVQNELNELRLTLDRLSNENKILSIELDKKTNQIKELQDGIIKQTNLIDKDSVKEFVDKFYEDNKDIDIGVINTPLGDIDILPDVIEKHLLTQSILISTTIIEKILQSSSINIFNKNIRALIEDVE